MVSAPAAMCFNIRNTRHQESTHEDVSVRTKGFESENDCSDHDDEDAGGDDAGDGEDDDSDVDDMGDDADVDADADAGARR